MTAYKRCPFCEELFAIGSEDDEPMRRHIGQAHPHEGGAPDDAATGRSARRAGSYEDVRFALRAAAEADSAEGLLLALLYKRDVLTPVLTQWYGVPESAVSAAFDRLDADLSARDRETES